MKSFIGFFAQLNSKFAETANDASRRKRPKTTNPLTFEPLQPRALLATIAINDGAWTDEATWSNGVPTETTRAIISHEVSVELDGKDHVAKEVVIHGDLVVPEEPGNPFEADKSLRTRWVHVNSGGEFIVGTETDRFDQGTFTLTLTGTDKYADHVIETDIDGDTPGTITVKANDGFLMTASTGRIQFFGEDKVGFTKLAETAPAEATSIVVANTIERNFTQGAMDGDEFVTSPEDDGVVQWEMGDKIVIASSSYDYAEEEVRVITDVADLGNGKTRLSFVEPLEFRHYGVKEVYGGTHAEGTTPASQTYEIDMRAEVALLSRNIKIEGLEEQDTDVAFGDRANAEYVNRIRANGLSDAEAAAAPEQQVNNGVGGHLMFMKNSGQIIVDGVQLDRLGQASQKGRYPIHWHLGEDRSGDLLRNTSITNSNNRGVTIHGTSNLTIEGVVLHDIHGHGFFFEDAVETGNQLVGNLALGIHTVGGNDSNFASPGTKDPFVVDTHDSVLETGSRFSSSAAFWITNPSNTFVGNIAAGAGDARDTNYAKPEPAGTGFWFAIPRTVLGKSADNPLYDDIIPIFSALGQFDYNTSHTTAVGLNFDRGSDIEDGNLNGELRTNHRANEYEPRADASDPGSVTTHVIEHFTNYKATDAAMYHRGKANTIQFNNLRIADSYNAAWSVSENQFDNSLYVGHSQGNADLSAEVAGPRLYDGAGLHRNAHFAGFKNSNAYAFQVESSSFGPTMYHGFQNVSFEKDETYDHIAHAIAGSDPRSYNPNVDHDLGQPHQWIKAVMDLDGTLTTGVDGGAGFSIVPNIDFLTESDDVLPEGWDARLTDDIYARIRIENNNDGNDRFTSDYNEPLVRFTARDGDSVDVFAGQNNGNRSWVQIAAKTDGDGVVEGTFEVEFLANGVPANGFVLNMDNQDGGLPALNATIQEKVDRARIVIKIVGAGNFTPDRGVEVSNESDLRAATGELAYYRDEFGNLFINNSITSQPRINMSPGVALQTGFVSRRVEYGAIIEAEEFDFGIDGIAYHDSDSINSLGTNRDDTGVDSTEDRVGDITTGEWLEYTTEIVQGGYRIGLNVFATESGGQVRLLGARSNSAGYFSDLGTFDITDTDGQPDTIWIDRINLAPIAGANSVIRLEFVGSGFEVDSVQFAPATQETYRARSIAVGGENRIELEEFDIGGQGVAYNDTTVGNSLENNEFRTDEDVEASDSAITNDVRQGEWLEYTTDIEAGTYNIKLLRNWSAGQATISLFVGDSNSATTFNSLGAFSFEDGGNATFVIEGVDLSSWAGTDRVIRLEITDGDYMGLDALEFETVDVTAPTADIVDVSPDPRNSNAGVVTINFDEDVSGFDLSDLQLTRNGNDIDLAGLTLNQISPRQYTVDLSSVTISDGVYELRVQSLNSDIQDGAGNGLATDAIDQFMIDQVGPQVESVVVNDGDEQRSVVTRLTVTFSEVVSGVDSSAFLLMNTTTNTQVVPNVATEVVDGKTVATLTFSGSGIIGGSLADGDYTLTTQASSVSDAAGNQLDGNADGVGGDNSTDTFFRFFGDVNGDRKVNIIDYFQFRNAFRGSYDSAFDFNGDGVVNIIDFFQFRSRFGQTL
ncbi:MAG: G8 domain-containing protein [Planctomycetota bacterium]